MCINFAYLKQEKKIIIKRIFDRVVLTFDEISSTSWRHYNIYTPFQRVTLRIRLYSKSEFTAIYKRNDIVLLNSFYRPGLGWREFDVRKLRAYKWLCGRVWEKYYIILKPSTTHYSNQIRFPCKIECRAI